MYSSTLIQEPSIHMDQVVVDIFEVTPTEQRENSCRTYSALNRMTFAFISISALGVMGSAIFQAAIEKDLSAEKIRDFALVIFGAAWLQVQALGHNCFCPLRREARIASKCEKFNFALELASFAYATVVGFTTSIPVSSPILLAGGVVTFASSFLSPRAELLFKC